MANRAFAIPVLALLTGGLVGCSSFDGLTFAKAPATTTVVVVEETAPAQEATSEQEVAPSAVEKPANPVAAQPAQAETGPCDVVSIRTDLGIPEFDSVGYCDGKWAEVGKSQSDYIRYPRWNGTK